MYPAKTLYMFIFPGTNFSWIGEILREKKLFWRENLCDISIQCTVICAIFMQNSLG
jgi:hypothetical protein